MVNREVASGLFTCEAALIDWVEIFRQRYEQALQIAIDFLDLDIGIPDQIYSDQFEKMLCDALEAEGVAKHAAHLRWSTNPAIGIPSRAFKVWRRPTLPFAAEELIPLEELEGGVAPNGTTTISWGRPLAQVRFKITMPPSGGLIFGFSGAPSLNRWSSYRALPGGTIFESLGGRALTGMILPAGAVIEGLTGVSEFDAANDDNWELVEIVGLPIDPAEWAGIGEHDQDQGMIADGLVPPREAALQRYNRGRPIVGWPFFLAPGILAPAYQLPDGAGLIDEMNDQILDMIRALMNFPPDQMAEQLLQVEMPPPENAAGETPPTEPSMAEFSPLVLLLTGATSDPNLSLTLGYGTAIPQEDVPTVQVIDNLSFFRGSDDFHYMVTNDWDEGFDGEGEPRTLAALALHPMPALAGAAPTGVEAAQSMPMAPLEPDGDWRRSVRFSWQRVPKTGFYRVASYAAARIALTPGATPELLNETRESGGIRPIATTVAPHDGDTLRLSAVDRVVSIPPPTLPTQNGSVIMGYAAVTQTIFGLWGNWAGTLADVREPSPNRVPILSASLTPQLVPVGPAPAELVIEFGWDWSVRRPASILIGGRLYPAAKRSDPPPTTLPTLQLPRSLGAADPALEITFAGDTPSAPGGVTIQGLTPDGDAFAAFGPAQGDEVRRYRVTIPGFSLDFSGTPHIGLALFARAIERRAPGRIGPWAEQPFLTAASDPRPPEIELDYVDIASLPDARGECHARIEWPSVADAAGYWIYETAETTLREALGLSAAGQGETLTARLMEIRAAYGQNPIRTPFTRKFSELVQGTSLDVTLPRGSRDIHFYIVLAQSRTTLDSPWPVGPDAGDQLIPLAAPTIAKPQPPVLEVRPITDDSVDPPVHRAQITVTPRIGHRARRVVLYRTRVADAAREVDTMGLPIADIAPGEAGWTVETDSDAVATDFIDRVTGTDTPEGSWRRIWYRAEVWSGDEEERAILRGRSDPSPPQHVVIPPAGPPDLSSLSTEWPGGAPGNVLIRWTSRAPVQPTPVGAHSLSVDVRAAGAPGLAEPLLSEDLPLDLILPAGIAGETTWWRHGDTAPDGTQEYRALVLRNDPDVPLSVGVRLRDPIGRISESLLRIPAGPVDPEPVIDGLQILPIAPGVHAITWVSAVPVTAGIAGAYRVSVTARAGQPGPGPIIVQPRPSLPPGRTTGLTGRFSTPSAAPSRIGAAGMPGPTLPGATNLTNPIARPPTSFTTAADVPDIQLRKTHPPGAPKDDLILWRLQPTGAGVGFGAAIATEVSRFTVRVTAPDGRFAERSVEVS
ncbi:hypothetical protein KHP62_15270 [Rhodobacteraceae bacterium NNCM2]|nr:hypothetical protein [Coraliihabitans acroporae]